MAAQRLASGTASVTKRLFLLRHGQAVHNPRAEAARDRGCSHEEFLSLMKEDDCFDSPLTELGRAQATSAGTSAAAKAAAEQIELVVASPLSRALHTADLAFPSSSLRPGVRRVAVEHWREINGWAHSARRDTSTNLRQFFGSEQWDFSQIPEQDETWTEKLEATSDCANRAYHGLQWVLQQKEECVLVVAHGGIYNFMMHEHPLIEAQCSKRFGNCELRQYELSTATASTEQDAGATLTLRMVPFPELEGVSDANAAP
eukprot:gnl/TRDRNA2_/TRDRNA2_90979_c0_seq1.p1 gnl/TRDRNA2_/TRDRNA2_90979_c0~~gnl/TRDRNA2_/TRDRNA2_90979_c0_seq1.p1  ORF type:complete len:259 (+),score=51.28 gnl/TRDRNA2_/TRDRNA2_90979_c0_seq1:143-919(+)